MTSLAKTLLKADRKNKVFAADHVGALDVTPGCAACLGEERFGQMRVELRNRPLGNPCRTVAIETFECPFWIEQECSRVCDRKE